MSKPRRSTDLDSDDLTCLIKLCETRIKTINKHIRDNHFANSTEIIRTHKQLETTLIKLKCLKERAKDTCDGA